MRLNSLIPSAVLLALLSSGGGLRQATVVSGSLVKASSAAVYYVGADEQRYVFPNDKAFFTWYSGFNEVTTVSDAELAGFRIGGNVTYRPGVKLVKIQSDPKVYAVGKGGVLRWVKTEAAAVAIFGAGWNKKIDDVADSFFVNYAVGPDIANANDFDPVAETNASLTINADKNLSAPVPVVENPLPTTGCTPACGLGNACVVNSCQAVPGPSPVFLKTMIVDYADTCFVGDPCTTGACCTVNGLRFADNTNLKTVKSADLYRYADKQQLCGRASVSSVDRNRITQAMTILSDEVAAETANRVSVNVSQTRFDGDLLLSRRAGTCDWWMSPDDLRARFATSLDSSTDALFVISSRVFSFGEVSESDATTVDQAAGIRGSGYSYIVKEWETDTTGAASTSIYKSALASQLGSSIDLGITDPNSSYIGNHCRDNKKDIDETGVDCGGAHCNACP